MSWLITVPWSEVGMTTHIGGWSYHKNHETDHSDLAIPKTMQNRKIQFEIVVVNLRFSAFLGLGSYARTDPMQF